MPAENKFSLRLTKRGRALIKRHAKDHHMSQSEVVCMVLDAIAQGISPSVKPTRRTERLAFYDVTAGRLDRVNRKARAARIPATMLIDAALEEMLGD